MAASVQSVITEVSSTMLVSRWACSVIAVVLLGGCETMLGPDDGGAVDGGTDSRVIMDASHLDAGAADVGSTDAGVDTGPMDGSVDASVPMLDAGPPPPSCPRARVIAPGDVLNVRPDPSTDRAPLGALPDGYLVEVVDMVRGESIGGEDLWFEITSPIASGFVFAAFTMCTEDEIPADDGNYYVPFACGASVRVTQGPGGSTSHTGRSAYTTTYLHINSSSMSVGTEVLRGDVIAASGSTGYSTGPHLHLALRGNCPTDPYCQSIPLTMADVGMPAAPVTVTSGNCP